MVCCYSTASPFQQTTRTFSSSHLLTFLINELSKIVRNKTEDTSKPFHKLVNWEKNMLIGIMQT